MAPRSRAFISKKTKKPMATIYQAPAQKQFEETVAEIAEAAFAEQVGGDPFEGPVNVTMIVFLSWPQATTKKALADIEAGLSAPTKKPDNSNVAKSVEDAMNKIVFKDDAQVVNLLVRKRFSDTPRVAVRVTELTKPTPDLLAAASLEASTPDGANNGDDAPGEGVNTSGSEDSYEKPSESSQSGNKTACGAESIQTCKNHDTKGAPWCVDCLPPGLRDKSKRPKTLVVLGEEDDPS